MAQQYGDTAIAPVTESNGDPNTQSYEEARAARPRR